jgi:hypothetical protein
MALLHRAEIRPTKLELLAAWLPGRSWYEGPASPGVTRVAAYRFDDPEGEVGIETLLVRAGDGPIMQVPLTYRGAPLDSHDHRLVGTMEHSVLGRRWVYDACGDPVYTGVLAEIIRTGAGEAEELVETDGRLERRDPGIAVRGSGTGTPGGPGVGRIVNVQDGDPTVIRTERMELSVVRVLHEADAAEADAGAAGDAAEADAADGDAHGGGDGDAELTLTGTWTSQSRPLVLARARRIGG